MRDSLTRRRSLGALALTLLLGAGPARAQDTPEASLAQIREQLLHADYRAALEAVTAFVARDDLDAVQHTAGLEVLATIHIALRHDADAEAALAELYARDPGHQLEDPEASPPVIAAFGRARANPPAPRAVALADRTEALTRRSAPSIQIELVDGADLIAELRLRYRQGEGGFTTVVMTRDLGSASARIPVIDEADAYDVAYLVEARAPSGHVLARVGSEAEPARLVVPAREVLVTVNDAESDAVGSGDDGVVIAVVLAVVGALVVAGAIVTAVLVTSGGPQDGSLGNIELPLLRF